MQKTRRLIIILGALLVISSCGENQHAIFRHAHLDDGDSLITDAKQRAIINLPHDTAGGEPERIVCAEPSPDVAQSVSDAIKASLQAQVEGKGGGSAAFARSSAEAVAQLGERLATIQLLRDGLYRACEAYANGAIKRTAYTLIISRYGDTMITMLTGELMAGAFGRSGAALASAALTASDRQIDPKLVQDKIDTENAQISSLDKDIKAQSDKIADASTSDQDRATAKTTLQSDQNALALAKQDIAFLKTVQDIAGTGPGLLGSFGRIASGMSAISQRSDTAASNNLLAMYRTFTDANQANPAPLIASCVTALDNTRVADPKAVGEIANEISDLLRAAKRDDAAIKAQIERIRSIAGEANMSMWGAACMTSIIPALETKMLGANSEGSLAKTANTLAASAKSIDGSVKALTAATKASNDTATKTQQSVDQAKQLAAVAATRTKIDLCLRSLDNAKVADPLPTLKECLATIGN
jgi:hypothetical protein